MKRCAAVVAFAIALSATYASELLWPTESKAFAEGELGYWKGDIYKSLINANVWTPEAYPAGWERQ